MTEARALFDFESGGPGELSFATNEVLTILRQDVGDGWWEAKNQRGQKGLVPESYFEVTSFREPSIPPPPAPTQYTNPTHQAPQQSSWQPAAPSNSRTAMPTFRPPKTTQPAATGWSNHSSSAAQPSSSRSAQPAEPVDDWDDDWDDDDDDNSSTTTETQDMPGGTEGAGTNGGSAPKSGRRQQRDSQQRGSSYAGSVRNPFNRFSTFSKAGGDAYLFESLQVVVPETDKRSVIMDTADGPMWRPIDSPFHCMVASPKKETKFHGIKSFIAYQITPSFSNIQVSRRYKHFDWLHERLVEKYCTIAIPALPEKQISGRFEDDFVSQRLRQLQAWVDRMCKHPVVAHSDVFQHFLACTDDKKWKAGKRKAEKDEYLGGKFFLTVRTPSQPIDGKQAEAQLDKFGRFVKSMDDSVKHLMSACENNARKHQGPFKKEFQKLGDSFVALSKSFNFDDRPGAEGLTKAIEHTGHAYEDIGQLYAEQPTHDMIPLIDGLQEYKGLLSTFPDTLMLHKSAMSKVQEATTKMSESGSGKLSESDLQSVQSRADVISYAVLAEMQHFQQQRIGDFRDYMSHYLKEQIAFYKTITDKLEDTLRQY